MNTLSRRRRPRRLCVESLESRTVLSGAAYRPHFVDLIAAGAEFEFDDISRPAEPPPVAMGRHSLPDGELRGGFRGERPPLTSSLGGDGPEWASPRPGLEAPNISFVILFIPVSFSSPLSSTPNSLGKPDAAVSSTTNWTATSSAPVVSSASELSSSPLTNSASLTSGSVATSNSVVSDGVGHSHTPSFAMPDRSLERPLTGSAEQAASSLSASTSSSVHAIHDSALTALYRADAWNAVEALLGATVGRSNSNPADDSTARSSTGWGDTSDEMRGNRLAMSANAKSQDLFLRGQSRNDSTTAQTTEMDEGIRWSAEDRMARDRTRLSQLVTRRSAIGRQEMSNASSALDIESRESGDRTWSLPNPDRNAAAAAMSATDDGRWIELPVLEQALRPSSPSGLTRHLNAVPDQMTSQVLELESGARGSSDVGANSGAGAESAVETESAADSQDSPAAAESAMTTPTTSSLAVSTMFVALVSAWPYRRKLFAPITATLRRLWRRRRVEDDRLSE